MMVKSVYNLIISFTSKHTRLHRKNWLFRIKSTKYQEYNLYYSPYRIGNLSIRVTK